MTLFKGYRPQVSPSLPLQHRDTHHWSDLPAFSSVSLRVSTLPHLTSSSDGSNWYLSLGSFWTGIKSMKSVQPSYETITETLTFNLTFSINSSSGLLRDSSVTSLATRTANNGAIEASSIYKFGSFYYLFTSWDNCCQGTSSTYNIRVGRSTS